VEIQKKKREKRDISKTGKMHAGCIIILGFRLYLKNGTGNKKTRMFIFIGL
jgi:hypothetical protein